MAERLALIIANSEFEDPKLSILTAPPRDAEALAEVLRDSVIGAFKVTLLINESEQVIRRKIARFYYKKKREDLLLIYYSGHGIRDDYGDLYLATKDTEMEVPSATAIDAAYLRAQLDKSYSQRKIVILDCCHSGAFGSGAKGALGSNAGATDAFTGNGFGRVILTASNAIQYAWEGNKLLGEAETSVFTQHLVKGLQTGEADLDSDGEISLDELYQYIYEQVLTSGRSEQTPQKRAQIEGDIVIAKNPNPVVKKAKLPKELQDTIDDPRSWVREGAVRELSRLIQGTNPGIVEAAREALQRMKNDDSRRVSSSAAEILAKYEQSVGDMKPAEISEEPADKIKPHERVEKMGLDKGISRLDWGRNALGRWWRAGIGLIQALLFLSAFETPNSGTALLIFIGFLLVGSEHIIQRRYRRGLVHLYSSITWLLVFNDPNYNPADLDAIIAYSSLFLSLIAVIWSFADAVRNVEM